MEESPNLINKKAIATTSHNEHNCTAGKPGKFAGPMHGVSGGRIKTSHIAQDSGYRERSPRGRQCRGREEKKKHAPI